jgi:hypothetical protein
MATGLKVAGPVAPTATTNRTAPEPEDGAEPVPGRPGAAAPVPRRRGRLGRRAWTVVLAVLAVAGLGGTVGFGLAWAGLRAQQQGETEARAAARTFLVDLTNFDAKTVDADFGAVSAMATGPFAAQATRFFNSSIRQQLQQALASSRGQLRALLVQSYGGAQATVYGVVDQLYVNARLHTPRTDVLRIVLTMSEVQGRWKVADVTVLQGPSPGATPGTTPGATSGTTGAPGAPGTTPAAKS